MNIGLIRRCNCHDVTTWCPDEMTKFSYFLGGSEILVLCGGFINSCTLLGGYRNSGTEAHLLSMNVAPRSLVAV